MALFLLLLFGSAFSSTVPLPIDPVSRKNRRGGFSQEPLEVLTQAATEARFSAPSEWDSGTDVGAFHCGRCGEPLFLSDSKFDSSSGWPSFDNAEISKGLFAENREQLSALLKIPVSTSLREVNESDVRVGDERTEIVCGKCHAHMGHVFRGEHLTKTNTRHCVNSVSLEFRAWTFFAGGCFWGVEKIMEELHGVFSVVSGYMGGGKCIFGQENSCTLPSYQDILKGETNFAETVKVIYDPRKISYAKLVQTFFELHDPFQKNRQGPDRGKQYRGVVFYANEKQKKIVKHYVKQIEELEEKKVATILEKSEEQTFFPAEEYHQNYYRKTGGEPYCHTRKEKNLKKPFEEL